MKRRQISYADHRIAAALAELQELIQGQYPDAAFQVSEREDPPGVYLKVIVDLDDTEPVVDLVIERMLELQIDEGLPVWVLPVRPLERVLASLPRGQRPGRALLPSAR